MKKYSSGFAILEGLLIFVIVAILAGTVFFVYKANKNTSESLKNAGETSAQTPRAKSGSGY